MRDMSFQKLQLPCQGPVVRSFFLSKVMSFQIVTILILILVLPKYSLQQPIWRNDQAMICTSIQDEEKCIIQRNCCFNRLTYRGVGQAANQGQTLLLPKQREPALLSSRLLLHELRPRFFRSEHAKPLLPRPF